MEQWIGGPTALPRRSLAHEKVKTPDTIYEYVSRAYDKLAMVEILDKALTVDDFKRILREPNASLTEQYTALMDTEGVHLTFTDDAITRIAEVAFQVNEKQENIGARRLHTVMERLLESISFEASDMVDQALTIDASYVDAQLGELSLDEDLSQYIL